MKNDTLCMYDVVQTKVTLLKHTKQILAFVIQFLEGKTEELLRV